MTAGSGRGGVEVGEVGEVGRRSLASSAAVILPARGTCSPGGTSGVAGGGEM